MAQRISNLTALSLQSSLNTDLKVIPCNSSHEEYKLLYKLENSLDYHIKEWGSVEMLKYHASLIPEKCKPETNVLSLNNKMFGYGDNVVKLKKLSIDMEKIIRILMKSLKISLK